MKNTVPLSASEPSKEPDRVPPESRAQGADSMPTWLAYALIGAVALLAHGLALNADFYMDDFPHILEHEFVTEAEWDPNLKFRAIPYALYRQIYAIAGPSSVAFHTVNLFIHLCTAFVVFATAKLFFRRFGLLATDEARMRAAVVGAMAFAVHPLGTEAVNYARCTMIQLVTLFSLLAAFCALRWTEKRDLSSIVGAFGFSLLAAFSKTPGIFHAGLNLFIIGIVFFDRSWIRRARNWSNGPGRSRAIATCVAITIAILWLVPKWTRTIWGVVAIGGREFVDHWFTQGRVVWGYMTRMVAPVDLTSDHLLAWTRSPTVDAAAGVGLLLFIALGTAIAVGLFKPKTRVLCTLLALIIGPLALRFAYPIYEHFVEYRAYPALPWLGVLAGLGFGILSANRAKPAFWAAFAVITAGTTMSALRSAVWSDATALARNALEAYPLNNRPRTQLQAAAYRAGDYAEVLRLEKDIRAAYLAQAKFNELNLYGRQLDPDRAIYDLVGCEQFVTLAIAEMKNSKEAVRFANERIDHYRNHLGLEKESEIEKALESLLKARNLLEEHGEAYDLRKAQAKAVKGTGR
jgi:hypothetical protein